MIKQYQWELNWRKTSNDKENPKSIMDEWNLCVCAMEDQRRLLNTYAKIIIFSRNVGWKVPLWHLTQWNWFNNDENKIAVLDPEITTVDKEIIHRCYGCRKFGSTPFRRPTTKELPKDKTEGYRPFQVVGIDFSGSITYKIKEKSEMFCC